MPGMMDATCRKCGHRFGWAGDLMDRPPCPECGDEIPAAELERVQRQLEKDLQEIVNRKKKPDRPKRGVVCQCGNPLISTMLFSGAEFFCCECKAMVGFINAERVDNPSEELIEKHRTDLAWFREAARDYIPTGDRLSTCEKCRNGEGDHIDHVTEEQLQKSREARTRILTEKPC